MPGGPLPGDHGVNVAPAREMLHKDARAALASGHRVSRSGLESAGIDFIAENGGGLGCG